MLGKFLDRGFPDDAPRVETVLLIGAAQILFLDVPDHAAVDLSVRLVQADRRAAKYPGLINAVLRRVAREGNDAIAAVYDTPSILYFARTKGSGTVKVSGPPFRTEDYGIAFPAGSDLRPVVNAGLLKVIENGTYQAIYDKWFGTEGR